MTSNTPRSRRDRHFELFGAWMFGAGMLLGMWVAGFFRLIGVFQ